MPDYEKWQFEDLLWEAQRKGIPGAEKLERPHLVAILEIQRAEGLGYLLLFAGLIFNTAFWGTILLYWIPTHGVVSAAGIQAVGGVLGSVSLLVYLAVLVLQLRASKLKRQFRKITEEEQVKTQTGLMT